MCLHYLLQVHVQCSAHLDMDTVQGFIQAPFGGGDFPPNLATSPPPEFLASSDFLDIIVSGSANSTVLLKNHGNQILCEIWDNCA